MNVSNANALKCPRRKCLGTLERRMVTRDNIAFRCSACGQDEFQPLPPFPKKVVYLDQCAISSIVKAKDPFWVQLNDRLKLLIDLQLIACPYSRCHREESMLSERWRDKLQVLYKKLAGEDRFCSPDKIEFTQLRRALLSYLGHPEPARETDRWKDYCAEDPHRFAGDMLVYCHFSANEAVVSSVRQRKRAIHAELEDASDYWKKNPQGFKDSVAKEQSDYGRNLIKAYRQLTAAQTAIENMLSGELLEAYRSVVRPGKFDPRTSPGTQPGIELVHSLACEVLHLQRDEADPLDAVDKFFKSEQVRSVPFLDIQSSPVATIAQQTQSITKSRKPKPSDWYDVQAISCYAPYCDVMFLDNEFRILATQGNVDVPGRYGVRLFSEANREAFRAYLDSIWLGSVWSIGNGLLWFGRSSGMEASMISNS